MNIYWTSPPTSGLCDRLVDVLLVATYAKILNAQLYLDWPAAPVTKDNPYSWNDGKENRNWETVRYYDYLYENFSQYFTLPDNVHIKKDVPPDCKTFSYYIGGTCSPILFYEKFLTQALTLEEFLAVYQSVASQFRPTPKLEALILPVQEPYCAVHLRRGDKVRSHYGEEFLQRRQLEELESMTRSSIERVLAKGFNKLYFCSDSAPTLFNYKTEYPTLIFDAHKEVTEVEQTYVDIALLMRAKYIILSQKYSSFSFLSSLTGGGKLVYLYNEGQIVSAKYNLMPNFLHYSNL